MRPWRSVPLRWMCATLQPQQRRAPMRRARRRGNPECEALEGRVVLDGGGSFGNGFLLAQLSYLGVETSPVLAPSTSSPSSSNPAFAQLQKDESALQTELNSLAAKSGVTVSDLTALGAASQALGSAWHGVSLSTLKSDLSALVSAAAANPATAASSAADTAFVGLFPSASATQAQNLANAVITVVQDSGVSTSDLATVASDQSAVQTDVSALGKAGHRFDGFGEGFGGGLGGDFGGGARINGALSSLGVLTTAVPAPAASTTTSSNPLVAQLQTDQKALQTELNSLSAKSKVTVADLTALDSASQALGSAWRGISPSTFKSDLSALVTAAATNPSTASSSAAYTAFVGLFASASATQAKALASAVITVVQDSGVTTTDLATVSTDQAAVQTDVTNLRNSFFPHGTRH